MFAVALLALLPPLQVSVQDIGSLRAAVATAQPGTTILIGPGTYVGGLYSDRLAGTSSRPIVIKAADPSRRPRFVGTNGVQFQKASYLTIENIDIEGSTGNGIGIDDGGVVSKPAHHIVLHGLHVLGEPVPSHQGIKMAGVDQFRVENCIVQRWGGCAIDMVGCHQGFITECSFTDGGAGAASLGVQAKGGSSDVTIEKCLFDRPGSRGVNFGGSTGIPFYRPALDQMPANQKYESKNIEVVRCTFLGTDAPFVFANAIGGAARFNTVVHPAKWAVRILQETPSPGFPPSQRGVLEDNIFVFRSSWFEGGVNIGPNTDPASFKFARNFWYCEDRPERSEPTLPSAEQGGVYGVDPKLDPLTHRPKAGSLAAKYGAHAVR